jgi:PKD repeat protein
MKTNMLTKLAFSFLFLVAAIACSKKDSAPISTPPTTNPTPDPMALFNVTNTDMRAPVKIKFKNNSQHADTYLWEFGDGTTSTEKEPEKIFTTDGAFSVKLTASEAGKSDAMSKTVTIDNAPNLMYIEKISVTDVRMDGFDNNILEGNPNPDVYLRLSSGGASMSMNVIQNANSVTDLSWNVNLPLLVTRGLAFNIDVMDKDNFTTDDLMGSVDIKPEDYMTVDNRYPEVISKTVNGTTIELKVNWQFSPR